MAEEDNTIIDVNEYDALITRSNTAHTRGTNPANSESAKSRKSDRCDGNHTIPCKEHRAIIGKQYQRNCLECVHFSLLLHLPNGRLPNNEQVLSYYFSLNREKVGVSVAEDICLDIILHWISCNIYTLTRKIVRGLNFEI